MAESSRSVWYDASNVRHTGSSVCWSGVKVTAGSKKNPKPILKGAGGEGLSGYVEGGKFCAIMGPSGAGKTTLLNALAGRRLPNFEGTVLVDGKEPDRRSIAFVMQEDVLCPTQTPREALMFSAGLRLPATVSLAEKRKLVEATLRELKLERCADTLVGDAVKRGISGGEKKRTAVGIELVMVQDRIAVLQASSSCSYCFRRRSATGYRRTSCSALAPVIQGVRERPPALIRLARCHTKNPFFKVVPWRPRRPIVWLRQVLDFDGCHR